VPAEEREITSNISKRKEKINHWAKKSRSERGGRIFEKKKNLKRSGKGKWEKNWMKQTHRMRIRE
jgi:hypothetical protein